MITKLKKLLKRIAHKIEEVDKEGDSYLYTVYKSTARPHEQGRRIAFNKF